MKPSEDGRMLRVPAEATDQSKPYTITKSGFEFSISARRRFLAARGKKPW